MTLFVVLRLFHIIGGALWIGAVVVGVFFLEPAADELGEGGQRFLSQLVRRRLTDVMVIAATSAIIAGAALYWIDSGGLHAAWIGTSSGITFTIGGVAGLAAYVLAAVLLKPAFDRRAAGALETAKTAKRVRRWSLIQVALLLVALAAMAIGRYV
ncbi:MAG TPA: hypothetical protein VGJ46_07270 [Candidatus Limnocylindrales bacterium]